MVDYESKKEIVYQSERTVIFRSRLSSVRSVMCKKPLGPDSVHRVRHEAGILERLSAIEGISRLAARSEETGLIILEDTAGVSVADILRSGRMETGAVVDLALAIARIVAAMHRAGVLHRDLNPSNILLAGSRRKPELIDFDLATTFAEQKPGFAHDRQIVGTLAYIAPEQTGRTGRGVDQRADLYALGVTFYEFATGQLPFKTADPLQLLHDHLAHVPTPPTDIDSRIPLGLADIIMRLLEKEPDRRYQSAEGLAYDLSCLKDALARGESTLARLGERDFPLQFTSPSRLVGRDSEIEALQAAFDNAQRGEGRGILISGAPGVGKTALINELRPMVTAKRGWYIAGKFDQYRQDAGSGALLQALRGLGHLLLAEPEAKIAAQRLEILRALGPNAGLITALLPEFAILLGEVPETPASDPTESEVRLRFAIVELLRAVASPARPIVMVLDDLQWANAMSIRFFASVLSDENMRGLLLVGAYRDNDLELTHPLPGMLERWKELHIAPPSIALKDLPPAALATLLEEMLRLPPSEAVKLGQAIAARTNGNPYDTVELVNALRRDGALVVDDHGWRWDDAVIRTYVGSGDVVHVLAMRIAKLPQNSRDLLQIMACLGGEVAIALVEAASGLPSSVIEQGLIPALEDGLLVLEGASERGDFDRSGDVRFRHDRVRQAAYGTLDDQSRSDLHFAIAQRLAEHPDFRPEAAEQYLAAISLVTGPADRVRVAALFADAAARARLATSYEAAERFLAAAICLLDAPDVAADRHLIVQLETAWHAALYCLARYEQADDAFAAIQSKCSDPRELAEATGNQISSLTNRGRSQDALNLGLHLLSGLGLHPPSIDGNVFDREAAIDAFYEWLPTANVEDDCARPEMSDPTMVVASRLIARLMPAAFNADPVTMHWLILDSRRLWAEYGPCRSLLTSFGRIAFVAVGMRDDYQTAYKIQNYALTVGEARRWEPETSLLRGSFALFGRHWSEPLESCLAQVHQAREGLLRGGELQYAAITYITACTVLRECAPTLEACGAETAAGLAFMAQTGNVQNALTLAAYRQFVRSLQGETRAGTFSDDSFDEVDHLERLAKNPTPVVSFLVLRALTAAILGDSEQLATDISVALPMERYIVGTAVVALAHTLSALAQAQSLRNAPLDQQAAILRKLDLSHDWLVARAKDAPANFSHLVRFIEAERAWALGDSWRALTAFDSALLEVDSRQRPWHRALMTERAGLFHLENGFERTGQRMLSEAQRRYRAWGASAKVERMTQQHAFLQSNVGARDIKRSRSSASGLSSGAIDLVGILGVSQALSSETSLDRLRSRVADLVGAMTGATSVSIVLHQAAADTFALLPPVGEIGNALPIPVEEAAERGLLALSAFRYVQRNQEPLLVEDATRDDRFARDPYFAGAEFCSLLVVPILSQGTLRAVLLLENRLSRGAFTTDRLDAVQLIGGQLAVSLDNALLYASLEQKVNERTEALAETNRQLEVLSVTDPLTGLANRRRLTGVLEAEWQRAQRNGSSIAVAMIDIDNFKLYNDSYGHQTGDACLQRVANTLNDSSRRATDLVARYGGEEFAIVLPGATIAIAMEMAERARAAIAGLEEPHAKSSSGIVTVSIGVAACVPSSTALAPELVSLADEALYQAKRRGRNLVIPATDLVHQSELVKARTA